MRVTNVTNEKYSEVATYNAFNKWQYTPGTPRSVFAGLRYNWQKWRLASRDQLSAIS